NPPSAELRCLLFNSPLECGATLTDAERGVVGQRQSKRERRTETPAFGLRHGSHHLQLAPRRTALVKLLWKQRLKIVAARDDDDVSLPSATGRLKLGRSYAADSSVEEELHSVSGC